MAVEIIINNKKLISEDPKKLWFYMDQKIEQDINLIFNNYDINKLSNMEKRKMVFDYLVDHLKYNDSLFKRIAASKLGLIERTSRNTPQELYDAVFTNVGICNSISQYYKLILEKLGIPSYYVVCTCVEDLAKHQDELKEFSYTISGDVSVGHALTVNYDDDTKSYGIDDLTLAVINKDKDNYFNYDISKAHFLKQGLTDILPNIKWHIIDEAYIDMISGRRNSNSLIRKIIKNNHANVNLFLKENKIAYEVENIDDKELVKGKVV